MKNYYSHPIYPIPRTDTKPNGPSECIRYQLSPEEHERYKQMPVPTKRKDLDTTAPQRRRHVPGVTKSHSYEKKGGEGA